jgi:hypothetical protein
MTNFNDKHLPGEFENIADRLRAERPEATPLELDRIKLQAKSRTERAARRVRSRRRLVGSPVASLLVAVGLLAGGTGVVAAAGGTKVLTSGSSTTSATSSQYKCKPKPPKGAKPPPPRNCERP